MPTLANLAEELAVDPRDIAVLASGFAELRGDDPSVGVADDVAEGIREQLNPHGERTRFDLYWPEADRD